MITKKKLSKRITDLQVELRDLHGAYRNLLDERASLTKDIRQRFTDELARFRTIAEKSQTDSIKFGVLEEWIKEVFELNNLKFSDKDFIEKSKEQLLREKIVSELNASVKSTGVNVEEIADILIKVMK